MIDKFFAKKSAFLAWSETLAKQDKIASSEATKNEIRCNKRLTKKIRNPIIRKFKKRKLYSSFVDNICGADLSDMQLISKVDKGIRFLLCVINIF